MFVLAAEGLKEEWVQRDGPVSRMWDQKNSRFARAFITANTKGGMKGGLTGDYLSGVFSICWPIADRPLHPDPEKAAKGVKVRPVALGDGFEDHWSGATLDVCDVLEFDLQLRVPHTSHRTQGCDTDQFPIVKKHWRKRKAERVVHNLRKKKKRKLTFDYSDCMTTVKLPWQYGFRQETCANGWRHIGIYPFSRSVYWDLLLEKGEVLEAVEEVADTGFDIESVNWSVMFGEDFSDGEEEDDEEEDTAPKVRLTSGDLAFRGPANNEQNRAEIRAKRDMIEAKALAKAQRKEDKSIEQNQKRLELITKSDAAEVKLAVKGSVECITVDDIKAIMLKKCASSDVVPLGSWAKPLAIAAYNKFIQTVSAQPLAIEGPSNN